MYIYSGKEAEIHLLKLEYEKLDKKLQHNDELSKNTVESEYISTEISFSFINICFIHLRFGKRTTAFQTGKWVIG